MADVKKTAEEKIQYDPQYILQVKDLKKYFPIKGGMLNKTVGYVKAVDGVTFNLKRGTTMGLVGESGTGKSTLARTILGIVKPDQGQVIHYTKRPQMIFQDPYACLDPLSVVSDIVAEGMKIHKMYKGPELEERVLELLKMVGLNKDHANRFPHEFSGGQRQRIGIARALSLEPKLIVCDEPISALDVSIQAQILNLLKDLQEKKKLTYVFVSHDMSVISHISDRVLVMYLGQAVELAEKEDLFEHPLHPYTQALMQAVPIPDPREQDQCKVLEGEIPSPMDLPSGCPFCARCKKALAICKEIRPQMAETADGHQVACHLYTDGGKQ